VQLERVIHCVDAHAEGEQSRVVVGGVLGVPGASMLERMRHLQAHGDELRRFLLYEPRGHAPLSADLVLPATQPGADAGFVIMESSSYEGMSGSNAMCTAAVLVETGMLPEGRIVLEAPAGLVPCEVRAEPGGGRRVTFRNVPAFALALGVPVAVPGLGEVAVDVAYGGAFCAFVDAAPLGFALVPEEARRLADLGEAIRAAVAAQVPIPIPPRPRSPTSPSSSSPPRRARGVTPATRPWSPPGGSTAARPAPRPPPASPCSPPAARRMRWSTRACWTRASRPGWSTGRGSATSRPSSPPCRAGCS